MGTIIAYILLFILQIALLVLSVRRKSQKLRTSFVWVVCISILMALGLGVYYNIYGGPNFEGFFEVLISFGAVIVYGLLFLISFFVVRKK